MVDKPRVLSKIDELEKYLQELKEIAPKTFKEYQKIEKKRSCERILQLSIECTMDICKYFVAGLKLGLPADENDLLDKISKKKIFSTKMVGVLKQMRGLRNILVHEYAQVDDEMVFDALNENLRDFDLFKKEVLKTL